MTKLIIDIEAVKDLLLNEDIAAYSLAIELGISRQSITNYRNGHSDFNNMPVGVVIKLQEYLNRKEEQKMTNYSIYLIRDSGYDTEPLEETFESLDEAKAVAERWWDHWTYEEQKTNSVEVRTKITDSGYDIAFELNHDIQKAINEVYSCQDEYDLIKDSRDSFDDEDEYLEELNEAKEYLDNAKAKLNNLTQ